MPGQGAFDSLYLDYVNARFQQDSALPRTTADNGGNDATTWFSR